MNWCAVCGMECRLGNRGEYFHVVKNYPELGSLARDVIDINPNRPTPNKRRNRVITTLSTLNEIGNIKCFTHHGTWAILSDCGLPLSSPGFHGLLQSPDSYSELQQRVKRA